MFAVLGGWKGVVGGGAAEEDESCVAEVFAKFWSGGGSCGCWGWAGGVEGACGGGGGGEGFEEVVVVVERRRVGVFESECSEHFWELGECVWVLGVVQEKEERWVFIDCPCQITINIKKFS